MTIVSSTLLGEIIQNKEATNQIAKWALELMDKNISYAPRSAIKSQALADLLVEWAEMTLPAASVNQEYWTMYFDGSLMKTGTRG